MHGTFFRTIKILPTFVLAGCIFMKHTGKTGHSSSILTIEKGFSTHAGMQDGRSFPICLNSLVHNCENTDENEVYYTAGNLENREIRINTHTHTHTSLTRQYTTNPLNYNGLEKYISTREAPFLQINYRSHTIPPPCRSRSERNFHVPGAMRYTASSRPHVPGTFCTIRTTNQ